MYSGVSLFVVFQSTDVSQNTGYTVLGQTVQSEPSRSIRTGGHTDASDNINRRFLFIPERTPKPSTNGSAHLRAKPSTNDSAHLRNR